MSKNPAQELKLWQAFRLDAYVDPAPMNLKNALDNTDARTRMGQPLVNCFVVTKDFAVDEGHFTPTGSSLGRKPVQGDPFFGAKSDALVACRNMLARHTAARLAQLDRQIDQAMLDLCFDHSNDSGAASPTDAITTTLPSASSTANAAIKSETLATTPASASTTPEPKSPSTPTEPAAPLELTSIKLLDPNGKPTSGAAKSPSSKSSVKAKADRAEKGAKPKGLTPAQIKEKADKAEAASKAKAHG